MKKQRYPTKYVRIDSRTLIEVPVSVPDKTAAEKYLTKLEYSRALHIFDK